MRYRVLCRCRTCSLPFLAMRQSKPPQLHQTSVTEAGPLPSGGVMLPQPSSSTMSPAEFSCDRAGFRFLIPACLPLVAWHRLRSPGLGSSPFHSVPSPTPRCEPMVPLSVNPHRLAAFPRRRYGRPTQPKYDEADSSSLSLRPAALHLRSRSLEPLARATNSTSC